MYNTQDIATTIKKLAKKKGIALNELLPQCGLNINAISEFSKGKQMSVISFAKIADCLNCSVDYLLGRIYKDISKSDESTEEQRLLTAFQQLTEEGKMNVLGIAEMSAKNPQYQKYTDIPKEA